MLSAFLYLLITAIWGTTWLAIQYQVGVVSPIWSVAYRFAIAGVLLLIFCVLRGDSLRFNRREHILIAVQGVCLFSANCILFYIASQYLLSGIVALLFANVMLMNAISDRVFFKTPLTLRVILGALLGLLGLGVVFSSEIQHLQNLNDATHHGGSVFYGAILTLLAAAVASIGSMISAYNRKRALALFSSNGIGMLYGAFFSALFALCSHHPLQFSLAPSYLLSLAYLTLMGSLTAYVAYVALIGRIGPTKASYVFISAPMIALVVSTVVEDFYWTPHAFVGVGLILAGNLLVMARKIKPKSKH